MNLKFYTKADLTLRSLGRFFIFSMLAFVISLGSVSAQQAATGLSFDGVTSYVNIPVKPALNMSSAITLETWIYPTKNDGSVQDVICKSNGGANNGYIFPRTSDGWNTIEFLLNINGYDWQSVQVDFGKWNQWHHLAATYDGFVMKVYVDAVLKGQYEFAGSISVNNNPLAIGVQPGFDEYFGGKLDETRIWNRALTQCEISNNMNCELPSPTTQNGLVAYYKYNSGLVNLPNPLVTTVADASATGANGTLVNFSLTGLLSNWAQGTIGGSTCNVYQPNTATASVQQALVPIGGTISLSATGGDTYSWVGPNGYTSNQQNPTLTGVSLNASGTYTVTATKNGCSSSASVVVTVALMASGLDFDGVNDYVVVPNSSSLNATNLTIESWIYPTGGSSQIQNVAAKASGFGSTGFKFPKTNDLWNSFSFELSINNQWQVLTASFPSSALNQWNHVAATYDGFFMRVYLNGVLAGSLEVSGVYTGNNSDMILGNLTSKTQYYKGSVDELRIWSRALSQCEIINNMQTCELNGANNGLAQQVGLAAYYRFNQGLINVSNAAVTTLADSSGNGNNGTLTGFALTGTTSNWVNGKVNGLCTYFPLPNLTATANGSVFQTGSTVNLFATGGNGINNWTGPSAFTSNLQNPVINNAQPVASGTYTVTNPYVNCVISASTRVTVSDAPQITASGPTNICPSSSVTLTSTNTGTYQWYKNTVAITGATGQQYVASQTGSYNVTVTNGNGVIVSAAVTVTVVPDVTAPVPDVTTLSTINLAASPASPATVTVIPTATDNCRGSIQGVPDRSLTFTHRGTYTITWTYDDRNGNIATQTQSVVVVPAPDFVGPNITVPSNITVNGNVAICGAVVSFAATATDNSQDSVLLSYSQNPNTVFPIGTTTVTVTATDLSNNTNTATFTITVLPTVVAPITGTMSICSGATTTLATTSTGGAWSSDNTSVATVNASGVVTGLSAGTANIIYTNACGSTASAAITIKAVPGVPTIVVADNCGSSVLTASGASGASFLWNTGATTSSINVSNAASYTVTQTLNGCTSAVGTGASSPKAFPATPVISVLNNCGATTLTVANPPAGSTILWTGSGTGNGATTSSITITTGGTYTVTVTNSAGCSATSQPVAATVTVASTPPSVTVVNNCGNSVLTASGTSGANFTWSTGETTASITVTNAGTYTVTQTANGCTSSAGSGISAPKAIPATPVISIVNNCGSTTLSTATPAAGCTLLWNGSGTGNGSTAPAITINAAGTYTVTITNSAGCSATSQQATATVTAVPAAPVVTVTNNCGNTTLSTNATGSLLWSTNETTASITVSNAGSYTVTQTANGCISGAGTGVAAPVAIPAAPSVAVANNCGNSVLTASGTSGAGFVWNTGGTTASITVNNAASYTVTQTANGCTSAAATGVSAPKAIPATPVITVTNNCGSTTLSTATPAAGCTLLWNGSSAGNGATTPSITVSAAGTYTVTITTSAGCSATSQQASATIIAVPAAPSVSVVNNCGNSVLTASGLSGAGFAWSTGATTPSITVTNAASYTVTQTVNGCTSAAATGVTAPLAIPAAPSVAVVNNCGNAVLTVSGASGASFLWNTGATNSSITVNNAASYTVTQTVNGCTSAAATGVSAPNAIPATPLITVVNNCGSTTLSAATPAPGNTLLWNGSGTGNGATTSSITVNSAGTYTVTLTNSAGCSATSQQAAVGVNTNPTVAPITGTVTVVTGLTTQLADATGGGVWSSNSGNATVNASGLVTGVSAGSVVISYTVTNGSTGCATTVSTTVTVSQPSCTTPVISGTISNIIVNSATGSCSGTAAYSPVVSGTPAPVWSYTFSGASTASGSGTGSNASFNLGATTVVLKATNSCGTATAPSFTVTVKDVTPPVAIAKNITVALDANGQATVAPSQVNNGSYDNCSSVVLAFQCASAASTQNLVSNGDFGSGYNGWTASNNDASGGWKSSGGSPGGYFLLNSNGSPSTDPTIQQTINGLVPGQWYTISGVRSNVENGAYGNPAALSFGVAIDNTLLLQLANTGGANWIPFSVQFKATASTQTLYISAERNGDDTQYGVDNISVVASPASTACSVSSIAYNCSNLGTNTVTLNVTDASGNTSAQTATVTVIDNTAPVITAVANQAFCANGNGSNVYTVPALSATDNCSIASVSYAITGATTRSGNGYNASGVFNIGTSTLKWTVTDASGNTATSTTTVTINPLPVAGISASNADAFCSKLTLTGTSTIGTTSYVWVYNNSSIFGTNQQISLGQTNGDGLYTVYAIDNTTWCSSAPANYNYQKQNLASSYTLLAFDDLDLGQNNTVASGSMGVINSASYSNWWFFNGNEGKASFGKNSSVASPGSFVKAQSINKYSSGINIANTVYSPATVNLPTMQYNTASTRYLPGYTVSSNATTTLTGNYSSVYIKKGANVTLSGTVFGTITMEAGTQLKFTSSVVNIDQLKVLGGPKNGYNYVRFAPNSSVLVSTQVSIGSQTYINPDNYKVTFYLGDNSCDAERFSISGGDIHFTGNIYMPNGKLKVNAAGAGDCGDDYWWWSWVYCNNAPVTKSTDNVYMTGLFLVQEEQSIGYGNVIWNSYDCSNPSSTGVTATTVTPPVTLSKATTETETATTEEALKVTVMPNPATTFFTLKLESKFETPVNIRVMDGAGRVIDAKSKVGSNSTIQIGHNYSSGTYYAELIQGTLRKVVQLMKVK